ncbi:MAG: hypothetical protein ACTTJC_02050 [Campylobacter sp.]
MYKDNIRKKKDDSFTVKNYENNLKVSYEAIRKDYDIAITSLIPTQKNLIRTYLWLDLLLLGFCFTIARDSTNVCLSVLISITSILCVISIVIFISALYYHQKKSIVNIDIQEIADIQDNEYSHAQGLINLIHKTQTSYDKNISIIEYRAKYIRWATRILIVAVLFFASSVILASYLKLS